MGCRDADSSIFSGYWSQVMQFQCPLRLFHLWLNETVLLEPAQRILLPSAKISVLQSAEQVKHWGSGGRLHSSGIKGARVRVENASKPISQRRRQQTVVEQWWKAGVPQCLNGMAQHEAKTGCHSRADQCAQKKALTI